MKRLAWIAQLALPPGNSVSETLPMCIGQLTLTTSDLESSNHSGHIVDTHTHIYIFANAGQ